MLPLKGGRKMQSFVASGTGIHSLRSLGTRTLLSNLRSLDLSQNPISSISALSGAFLLRGLWLAECQLKDYSQVMKVIKKLKFLEVLDIRYNPMIKFLYAPDVDPSNCNGVSGSFASGSIKTTQKSWIASSFQNTTSITWVKKDEAYLSQLNDVDYVKRQCYRISVIHSLKDSIRILDGYEVTSKEKRDARKKMDKLRRILKGKERLFKDFIENLPDVDDLADVQERVASLPPMPPPVPQSNDRTPNESLMSPFKDWKPVSKPLSSLASHRSIIDFDSTGGDSARIEIPTPYLSRSMTRL